MTIGQARVYARNLLAEHSDAPELDTDWLLLSILHKSEVSLLTIESETSLTDNEYKRLTSLLQQRISGIPLAYILGEAHFYGRVFAVTPEVLIPRPATEALVQRALKVIQDLQGSLGRPLVVADIGTGSGCVAITLLMESASAIGHMIATDISPAALLIAQQNVDTYELDKRITFLPGNMLEPIQDTMIDLLVSNPPYVPTEELDRPSGQDTVGLRFEPRQALDGGQDGLLYVQTLIASGIPAVIETVGGEILTSNI